MASKDSIFHKIVHGVEKVPHDVNKVFNPHGGKFGLHNLLPGKPGLPKETKEIGHALGVAAKTVYSGSAPKSSTPKTKDSGNNFFDPKQATADANKGKTQTEHIQQILRNHGYDIAVDGVPGPQTESALKDFHSSNGDSQKWNRANVHTQPLKSGTTSVPTGKSDTTATTTAKTTYKPVASRNTSGAGSSGSGSGSGGGGSTSSSDIMQTILKAMNDKTGMLDPKAYETNPQKYGQATANATYNPQINAAKLAISQAVKQGKINIADLTKWFGAAENIAKTGAAAAHTQMQADQKGNTAAATAILNSFGGNAGAGGTSLANTAQNDSTQLASQAESTDAFNNMLKGLISTQAASAKTTQQNMDNASIADIRNTLSSLIGAKANELTKDTADAKNQNLSNLVSITNANNSLSANNLNRAITLAELPGTLDASNLGNAYKQSEIDKNNALINQTLQNMHNRGLIDQATYDHLTAETHKLTTTKATTKLPKGAFANAMPADIINARNYLTTQLKNANPSSKQQIINLATAYSPWSVSTPGVFQKVIMPALIQGGYNQGINPASFGL
jgi:hypothetical protein